MPILVDSAEDDAPRPGWTPDDGPGGSSWRKTAGRPRTCPRSHYIVVDRELLRADTAGLGAGHPEPPFFSCSVLQLVLSQGVKWKIQIKNRENTGKLNIKCSFFS